ncbi:transcription termination/antitermination NusG family protein [Beduini massiliensis]|uniref:transcription termination/antitermination NusG family protein n=1 Tax=Beduini massiliensis TaxID=1585974 RepID=UPI00059A8DDA|nr:transcription termination/antitermination NusG family protein [Beduini massiliensis]
MNWYILYVLSNKLQKLLKSLNDQKELHAFIPLIEYYRRDTKGYALKPLFPNYIFIKTGLNQIQFDILLTSMKEDKNGLIKQLKYKDAPALSQEEICMFERLLDSSNVLKMSQAYLIQDKAIITGGPLKNFENDIIKIDKHNQLAFLKLKFMNRYIQAGLNITSKI